MSIIKPKRGTGSPAGSIETNEIAMDTAAKILYVSTDGTNAVNLANDTRTYLTSNYFLQDFVAGTEFPYTIGFGYNKIKAVDSGLGIELQTGAFGGNPGVAVKINASALDLLTNPINNVQDPTNAQDGATKAYVDTTSGLNLPLAGGTMTGDIDLNSNDIDNIKSLVIEGHASTSNADMIIGQGQYAPNAIQLLADKSQDSRRNSIWFNVDDAGASESVGQLEWQADGPSNVTGEHKFRINSWNASTFKNDTAFEWHRGNESKISNGFYESSGEMSGYLRLSQDNAQFDGLALSVTNGRSPSTGTLGPNSMAVTTDMSQDTAVGIMNSATYTLDYKGSAIPTTYTQNTMTFNVQNDAGETAGTSPVVGRISAVQNADPLENRIILRSSNHGNTGGNADNGATQGGDITLTSYLMKSNVPVSLPVYTLTEANALSNVNDGSLIYVSNGNAGAKTLAVWDGSDWKVVALGATIS